MHQFWQVNTVYSKNIENQREWETISSFLVCFLICYRLYSKHESKWKLPSTQSQSFFFFCFYIILPTLSSNLARTHFNRFGFMCANVTYMVPTFIFIAMLKRIFYIDSLEWQKNARQSSQRWRGNWKQYKYCFYKMMLRIANKQRINGK